MWRYQRLARALSDYTLKRRGGQGEGMNGAPRAPKKLELWRRGHPARDVVWRDIARVAAAK